MRGATSLLAMTPLTHLGHVLLQTFAAQKHRSSFAKSVIWLPALWA
jgi:hypothetical protein